MKESPLESILKLTNALGIKNLSDQNEVWSYKVDSFWTVAINPCEKARVAEPPDCMRLNIAPFEFVVWYNGFVAGIFSATGDGLFASGSGANISEFTQAIDRHIEMLQR